MTGKKDDGKKNLAAAGELVRGDCLWEEFVTAAVAILGQGLGTRDLGTRDWGASIID